MPKRRRRGDGSVESLPSGRFRAVLSLGVRDKKRVRLTFVHPSELKCHQWLRAKLAERDRGQLADDGGLTVGEWMQKWLTGYRGQVEESSYYPAALHVRKHILTHDTLSRCRLSALRPAAVADFYATLARGGVSAAMQRKIGVTLGCALQEAVRMQMIAGNAVSLVRKPKHTPPEFHTWTAAEVRRFLAAVHGDRIESLFVLALDTGMRQGELLGLQWESVDMDAGRVRVVHSLEEPTGQPRRLKKVKTKASRRLIALSPPTVEALRGHRQAMIAEGRDTTTGPVFCSPNGHWFWKKSLVVWRFAPAVKKSGVRPIRFHDLRHTHATLSLAAGANLRAVSARLGHQSPAFTLTVYAHALPESDERIAQIWGDLLQPLAREAESAQPGVSDTEE